MFTTNNNLFLAARQPFTLGFYTSNVGTGGDVGTGNGFSLDYTQVRKYQKITLLTFCNFSYLVRLYTLCDGQTERNPYFTEDFRDIFHFS